MKRALDYVTIRERVLRANPGFTLSVVETARLLGVSRQAVQRACPEFRPRLNRWAAIENLLVGG